MAKILVIEDYSPLGRLYQTVLGRSGHEVILAQSGEAGVAAVALERPDLVIMDLVLPGMSGLLAARKLQEAGIFPGTALIITSAMSDAHAKAVPASLGAASVLVKPFDIEEMTTLVRKALAMPESASPRP